MRSKHVRGFNYNARLLLFFGAHAANYFIEALMERG